VTDRNLVRHQMRC